MSKQENLITQPSLFFFLLKQDLSKVSLVYMLKLYKSEMEKEKKKKKKTAEIEAFHSQRILIHTFSMFS